MKKKNKKIILKKKKEIKRCQKQQNEIEQLITIKSKTKFFFENHANLLIFCASFEIVIEEKRNLRKSKKLWKKDNPVQK